MGSPNVASTTSGCSMLLVIGLLRFVTRSGRVGMAVSLDGCGTVIVVCFGAVLVVFAGQEGVSDRGEAGVEVAAFDLDIRDWVRGDGPDGLLAWLLCGGWSEGTDMTLEKRIAQAAKMMVAVFIIAGGGGGRFVLRW